MAAPRVFCYDSRVNQLASFQNGSIKREISYSSFDAATVIRSTTPRNHVTRFNYGAGHQRLRRYDIDGSNPIENSAGKVTHYAGDAEITTKPDGSTEVRRYVSGMTQVQLIPATGSVQTRREYLMTDALGSTHRIVSEAGVIVTEGKQAFATFGERANADDRSTLSEAQQANFNALLPRGYTGHQQADEVGVIHMNGRIYDPRLGRFLQADSLIEDIFDPQAINSYSYVHNNPMNATDPTGHWRAKEQGILRQVGAIAITVATGVHIGGILGVSCPGPALAAALATEAALAGAVSGALTTGTLKGTLLGALGAFTFHQIGIATLSQGERIFAHGLAGGTLEVLGGGKFGHGFVSAGLSKALSPLADTGYVAADGAINAAIGGTVSEITGGDFANGAVMAATQYAFNALAQAGNNSVNVENVTINFKISSLNPAKGFLTQHKAAIGQYKAYESKYDAADDEEVRGLIIRKGKRFFFSTVGTVPLKSSVTYAPKGKITGAISAFTHTHPDSASFSGLDYMPGYETKADNYVRNSNGRIDYWAAKDARKYGEGFDGVRPKRIEEIITDSSIKNICERNLCRE